MLPLANVDPDAGLPPEGATIRCLCPECRDTAFWLRHPFKVGDLMLAKNIINVDGAEPEVGSRIKCGSCGWGFVPHVNVEQMQIYTRGDGKRSGWCTLKT